MSKRTYTAEEVVDIVQRALGVKSPAKKEEGRCEDCGRADMRESRDGGLYCHACYVEYKKQNGTWRPGGAR